MSDLNQSVTTVTPKEGNTVPNEVYAAKVRKQTPKTAQVKTMVLAFLVGGIICMVGQGFADLIKFIDPGIDKVALGSWVSVIMIFIGATLTGVGLYDDIGKFAGAGSIVPITGFANSVVSPAIEFKTEGYIYGMESKMFLIAGPIIVSGVVSAIAVGVVYWVISLF